MKNKREKVVAGLVAINRGKIRNSQSSMIITNSGVASGLCQENHGVIENCVGHSDFTGGKGERAGLCFRQKGQMEGSYWVMPEKQNGYTWTDKEKALEEKALSNVPDTPKRNTGESIAKETTDGKSGGDIVEIKDAEGLSRIGTGAGKTYVLTSDINLRGRKWAPIGIDPVDPFEGHFNGNGFEIKNYKISSGKYPYAGLFGCIGKNGIVENLFVDCMVVGKGNVSAPLCANNEGMIRNCVSGSVLGGSRVQSGLVAQNMGEVSGCIAMGKIGNKFILSKLMALVMMVIIMLIVGISVRGLTANRQEVFAPIIVDPNVKPIEADDAITQAEPDDMTDTGVSFVINADMVTSVSNYAASVGIKNPSWAKKGFTVTLSFANEEYRRLGGNASGEWVTVYESGLIKPGYGIDIIELNGLSEVGQVKPGEYELTAFLSFYDEITNEKAAIDTTMPVHLEIKE